MSIGWAKTYYYWLRARPLSIDTAARYIGHLKAVLQYAVEQELLESNRLSEWHITAQPARIVSCLSPAQLRQLVQIVLPGPLDVVRKWALLSCYTGLDFKDAVRVARQPSDYITTTAHGAKLVIKRLKFKAVHRAQPEWGCATFRCWPKPRCCSKRLPSGPR
ncbi:hypothetical protein GCM10027299_42410 [Larkinella ripae]